jgi:hypothetical protein
MAPLNNPNGNSVSEIILPDGATASEVIAPDGSTVFGNAIPDILVDDFEDNDIAEYGDDNSSFAVTTSNAVEGSRALTYNNSNSGDLIVSFPGDGLQNYPDAGDKLRVLLRGPNFTEFAFAVEGGPQGYLALISGSDNDMRIRQFDGNSVNDIATASPSLTATDWYWGEIGTPTSGDPSISFDLYEFDTSNSSKGSEVESLSVTDSTSAGRGVGARAGTDGLTHTAIDDIRVF